MNAKRFSLVRLEELPPGTCRSVETEAGWVAIYNVEGRIYATDDVCPHAGGPLGEGHIKEDCVVCPWHGWRFNVKTGQRVDNPDLRVACFDVTVENGLIMIEVPLDHPAS
jgi:nitrite reductase (NADH) small subunit/3-phenylpropionate/trans-cinnamate dioxygenase ferredoxin subunit